jgi:hypothetical protein
MSSSNHPWNCGLKTIHRLHDVNHWTPQDTDEMALIGEPICTSTLSNHWRGPFRWISTQHGVLVTSWRWYSAPQPFTNDILKRKYPPIRIPLQAYVLVCMNVIPKINPSKSTHKMASNQWMKCLGISLSHDTRTTHFSNLSTRVNPKVSRLATWSENCKWYSSLPLGAVVSLFCESV